MDSKLAGILLLSLFLGLISSLHIENQSRELGYVGYDESVYYSLARHIRETSPFDYTLNGAELYFNDYRIWYIERPIFHHPPLFTWLLAIAQLVLGSSLLAGRLLNVLIGTLVVYVTYLITHDISKNEQTALTAGFLLAITPLHVQLSSLVLMDELLTLFIALYVLSLLKLQDGGTSRAAALSGLFLGLALLTKYSAVLALPILVLFTAYRRIALRNSLIVLGVALALSSWWFAWNFLVYSTSFLTSFREFWHNPNAIVPFYAYVFFLPVVAPTAILGYMGVAKASKNKDTTATGIASVIVAFIVFFTLLPLKESRFVLPILPLFVVLGCLGLFGLSDRLRKVLTAIVMVLSLISVYVIVKGGYFWYLPLWHYGDWPREFLSAFV